MATQRDLGYIPTATVWNAVLSRLTDDGQTFSGNFNGGSVAGTTGTFSGVVTANAANVRGVQISRAGADAGIQIASTGGSGKTYGITAQSSGILSIQDDSDATPRIELSGNTVNFAATSGVTNANYYTSAAAQPGFLVFASADQTGVTGSIQTVAFGGEIYDTTNSFASNQFTAPVAGIYLLSVALWAFDESGGTDASSVLRIVTSNRTYLVANDSVQGTLDAHTYSATVLADMDAGDVAFIAIDVTGGPLTIQGDSGSPYPTWFCGRLLP